MHLLHHLSLKALYTFSVASRHLNFTKTAKELHITPSAVSHQIKRLEITLGYKLFESEGKLLRLTPDAVIYAASIEAAFLNITHSTKEFMSHNQKVINVGVSSDFAVKRLTPELGIFQKIFPELDLRLRMITCEDDITHLNLDIILSSKIDNIKYQSDFICDESYYPVCSKSLFQKIKNVPLQNKLSAATLIDLVEIDCWKDWFLWKKFDVIKQPKMLYFSHTLLMLQAVSSGHGIALLDKALIKNELESGELILLDKEAYLQPNGAYYFSYLKRRKNDINLHGLKDWVKGLFE